MHVWVDGWDWFWMSVMMGLWVVVLGLVVYLVVRLTERSPGERRRRT